VSKPTTCTLCQRPCWGERCASCRDAIGPTEVTSFEAVDILGVTYRQVDYWVTTILGRATGIGKNRRISLDELIVLAQLTVMVRAGLMLFEAKKHIGRSEIVTDYCTISIDQEGIAAAMFGHVQRLRARAS
jgi:hypothetical protein